MGAGCSLTCASERVAGPVCWAPPTRRSGGSAGSSDGAPACRVVDVRAKATGGHLRGTRSVADAEVLLGPHATDSQRDCLRWSDVSDRWSAGPRPSQVRGCRSVLDCRACCQTVVLASWREHQSAARRQPHSACSGCMGPVGQPTWTSSSPGSGWPSRTGKHSKSSASVALSAGWRCSEASGTGITGARGDPGTRAELLATARGRDAGACPGSVLRPGSQAMPAVAAHWSF